MMYRESALGPFFNKTLCQAITFEKALSADFKDGGSTGVILFIDNPHFKIGIKP